MFLEGIGVMIGLIIVIGDNSQWGFFGNGIVDLSGIGDLMVNIVEGLVILMGNVIVVLGLNNINVLIDVFGMVFVDVDFFLVQMNVVNDMLIVEFIIVVQDDFFEFNFVFVFEEYNEYVCLNFNDVFGVFV